MLDKILFRGTAFALAIAGTAALAPHLADAGPGKKGHAHGHSAHKPGSHADHVMTPEHIAHGGMPGSAADVKRTIVVVAKDTEFNLRKIQVKAGETIRFVIKNKGELVHEFTIGPPDAQKAHQAEMMKMMEAGHLMADKVVGKMDHNHGNSALVEPGKQAEVIWMFAKNESLEFGCNVPRPLRSRHEGQVRCRGFRLERGLTTVRPGIRICRFDADQRRHRAITAGSSAQPVVGGFAHDRRRDRLSGAGTRCIHHICARAGVAFVPRQLTEAMAWQSTLRPE